MKNISFTVPYPIGTYLIKNVDGNEYIDQVNKYVVDEKGISVILMLDVETDPRLSTAISIDNLLQNWKEDTRLHVGMQSEDESIIKNGPIKSLNRKS